MNLNDNFMRGTRGRGRRNFRKKITPYHGSKKSSSVPSPATAKSSNFHLNWGENPISVINTSSSSVQRSSSKISSDEDTKIIVALTEGRGEARCEVGIAAICVSKPLLILCQIADTQSYNNTLNKLNLFEPNEILFPATFLNTSRENRLADAIKRQFPKVKVVAAPRSTFNKANGDQILSNICLPSLKGILMMLRNRYYATTAASALIIYLQENLYTYYAPGSIKIEYQESEGYCVIDISSADNLELVCCANPDNDTKYTNLFDVMNHCQTKIGKRTLRSCILQPLCDVNLIEERLDCVTELMKHNELLLSLQMMLQKLSSIDRLMGIGTIIPNDPQNCTNRQLDYILILNNFLEMIPSLIEVLSKLKQPFFVELKRILELEDFVKLRETVRENVQESARPAQGYSGVMQRCYAIKPGVNGLLDVIRQTYSERMDDMREYVKELGRKYDMPLSLHNNNLKGFHMVLNLNKHQKDYMGKSDIPDEFINVQRLANSFTLKTAELENLSTRLDDIMADILRLSNVMLHSLINEIKSYAHHFYTVCEKIAMLDVIQSLAEASLTNGYVRPSFGDYTELIDSRHPMLDFLLPIKPKTNSILSSDYFNIHIITGPNGAGKSIFIRQLMLIQVMAQVGCYVPASSAIFRSADRMYARVYFESNVECGASSFTLEIREVNYILQTMTKNSLIIMDELCRSTAVEEGTALAMAIVAKFAQLESFLYVTTHYMALTKLHDLYFNIKLWQMETIPIGEDLETFRLDYRFKLIPGVTTLRRYGVYLVRNMWPDHVMKNVDDILEKINKKPFANKKNIKVEQKRVQYETEVELRMLHLNGTLNNKKLDEIIEKYISDLQELGIFIDINQIKINIEDNFNFRPDPTFLDSTSTFLDPNKCNITLPRVKQPNDEEIRAMLTPDFIQFSPEMSAEFQQEFILQNEDENDSIMDKEISKFLEENPDNFKMFIPDVHLEERSFRHFLASPIVSPSTPRYEPSPLTQQEKELLKNGSIILSNDSSFKILTGNVDDHDMESIRNDLEIFSRSFDVNNDFSEADSFSECCGENKEKRIEKDDDFLLNNDKPVHLFPRVIIKEGPDDQSFISIDGDGSQNNTKPDYMSSYVTTNEDNDESLMKTDDFIQKNEKPIPNFPRFVINEGHDDLLISTKEDVTQKKKSTRSFPHFAINENLDDRSISIEDDITENNKNIENEQGLTEENEKPVHIFPNVIIKEGLDNTTISIDGDDYPDNKKIKIISNVLIKPAQMQENNNNLEIICEKMPESNEKLFDTQRRVLKYDQLMLEEIDKMNSDWDKEPTIELLDHYIFDDTCSSDMIHNSLVDGIISNLGTNEKNENENCVSMDITKNISNKDIIRTDVINTKETEEWKDEDDKNFSNIKINVEDDIDKNTNDDDASKEVNIFSDKSDLSKDVNSSYQTEKNFQKIVMNTPNSDKNKQDTKTSTSEASKLRNLDITPTSSEKERNTSSTGLTSISRERCLDSDGTENSKKKRRMSKAHRRFEPPRIISSSDDEKKCIYRTFSNRQLKASNNLALIKNNKSGIELFHLDLRQNQNLPIKEKFNVTIFSDNQSNLLETYLNSNDRNVFNFNETSQKKQITFNFDNMNMECAAGTNERDSSFKFCSNIFGKSLTPDGYFKQNKEDITNIMSKYLFSSPSSSTNAKNGNNIFEDDDDIPIEDFTL